MMSLFIPPRCYLPRTSAGNSFEVRPLANWWVIGVTKKTFKHTGLVNDCIDPKNSLGKTAGMAAGKQMNFFFMNLTFNEFLPASWLPFADNKKAAQSTNRFRQHLGLRHHLHRNTNIYTDLMQIYSSNWYLNHSFEKNMQVQLEIISPQTSRRKENVGSDHHQNLWEPTFSTFRCCSNTYLQNWIQISAQPFIAHGSKVQRF